MTTASNGVQARGWVSGLDAAAMTELELLRKRFRGHRIFHEFRWDRSVRYVAYRVTSNVQPHTIITNDLAELRDQLEQAGPSASRARADR
jgi:hypothetical protein